MEIINLKAQYSFGDECIPKCMLFIVFFERVELIKLEYLEQRGGGGEGGGHYPNTPQYTGVLLCNCNLYKYF